jgi:alpha-glucosidase
MAADLPENYEGRPEFEFIREVPGTWDETRVLGAEIGDFVTIARRKGDAWYLGSITDENARDLNVPLSFLEPGREYEARIYADGKDADWEKNPAAVEIGTRTLQSSDVLSIRLARGGGQAISLKPLAMDK